MLEGMVTATAVVAVGLFSDHMFDAGHKNHVIKAAEAYRDAAKENALARGKQRSQSHTSADSFQRHLSSLI